MARLDARPGDWKTLPFPEQAARLGYARRFSTGEFARLRRGLVPEQMEDKWFIVWQDDALDLHRSWTGMCVFRLRFAIEGAEVVVTEALVNRDPKQHGGLDEQDLNMLHMVVDSFLRFAERFP